MIMEGATARRAADRIAEEDEAARQPQTFPTPPMDLVVPTRPKRLVPAGPPEELHD
jgi:hypothetical protein